MPASVFNAMVVATESLSSDIQTRASYNSPWLNIIPKARYKNNSGLTQTKFDIENTEPTSDEESWGSITLANGSNTGACGPTYNSVDVGVTSQTYSPEEIGLKGPLLCSDDFTYDFEPDQFMSKYVNELAKRARRTWEKRYENLQMKLGHKVIVGGSSLDVTETTSEITATTFSTAPASQLTMDYLDQGAIRLIENGATDPDSQGYITWGESGPEFPLIIGLDALHQLKRNGSDFRADQRDGNASSLFERIGATSILRNWRLVPTLRPPRFIHGTFTNAGTVELTNSSTTITFASSADTAKAFAGLAISGSGIPASTTIVSVDRSNDTAVISAAATSGTDLTAGNATFGTANQLTRVPTYENQSASQGTKSVISPAYQSLTSAPLEAAVCANPTVYTSELVIPANSAGGLQFGPENWMGEWKFVIGGSKLRTEGGDLFDPTDRYGQHFARFAHAARPEYAEHGMTFVYLRDTTPTANVS